MTQIAQDGSFYFIDTPDKILTAFGAELGGLISVYGQNVKLTLEPVEGVEILEVMNDLDVSEEDGKVIVECDDLLAEVPTAIVLRVKIDEREKTGPRVVKMISATCTYLNVTEVKLETLETSLKIRFVKAGKDDTEDNDQVMEEVALQKVINAQAQAIQFADAGDYQGAQQVLYVAAFAGYVGTVASANYSTLSSNLADEAYASSASYAKNVGVTRSAHTATRRGHGPEQDVREHGHAWDDERFRRGRGCCC